MTGTRRSLARKVANDAKVTEETARQVLTALLDSLTNAFASGDRIELRDFGVFTTRQKPARVRRNPYNGESVSLPAKTVVQFSPSDSVNLAVHNQRQAGQGVAE